MHRLKAVLVYSNLLMTIMKGVGMVIALLWTNLTANESEFCRVYHAEVLRAAPFHVLLFEK